MTSLNKKQTQQTKSNNDEPCKTLDLTKSDDECSGLTAGKYGNKHRHEQAIQKEVERRMMAIFKTMKPKTLTLDYKSDWHTNPMGWINELWQDQGTRMMLGLSKGFSINKIVTFDEGFHFKTTFGTNVDGHSMYFTETGPKSADTEKAALKLFCEYISKKAQTMEEEKGMYAPPTATPEMDSTEDTISGPATLTGEAQVNTILTTATESEVSEDVSLTSQIHTTKLCSAQEILSFDPILDRWIELDHFTFSTSDNPNNIVKRWNLPQDFYSNTSSVNLLPFHNFVMCRPNIELMFKFNSHKFAQGRYSVTFVYDALNMVDSMFNTTTATIRPHVYLDMNESNEAILKIPYFAKAPFIMTRAGAEGYNTGDFCSVFLNCLSPLDVPDESPTTVPCTVFIRFSNTSFTGMRWFEAPTATAEMGIESSKNIIQAVHSTPIVGGIAKGISGMTGNLALAIARPFASDEYVKEMESRLKYVGMINNRDRPTDIREPMEYRPNVTGSLAPGVGVEAVQTMRLDPTATAIMLPEMLTTDSFKSIKDFITIPALYDTAIWKVTDITQDQIFADKVWPSQNVNSSSFYNQRVERNMTPLEKYSRFYQYYSGSIMYRFDFMCTQFHTGTVIIAYIPFNDNFNYDQARSGYYKTFDLREQRTVTFRVPYIRNTVISTLPDQSFLGSNTGIVPPSPGTLKMWVVNPLTPVQTVSTSVEILVYKYAGEDFAFSYPSVPISTLKTNESSRAYGIPEMERGRSETVDRSANFKTISALSSRLQVNEDHMNIKDLLRRWIQIDTTSISTVLVIPCICPMYSNRTITGALLQDFRWARGGMCFMLVDKSRSGLFSICHIPQGISCYGSATKLDHLDAYENYTSVGKTLWDSRINPTIKIEVPFNGVWNYIETQSTNFKASPPVYERVPSNIGQLLIRKFGGDAECDLSIYWRAADDFELVNFVYQPKVLDMATRLPSLTSRISDGSDESGSRGHRSLLLDGDIESNPGPSNDQVMASYMEEAPAQDFITRVWGGVKSVPSHVTESTRSVVTAIKTSGPAVTALKMASDSWAKTGDVMSQTLEYLKDLTNNIISHVKNSCSWLSNVGSIFNSTLHFLHMLINPTWQTFCIGITGVLTSIGNVFSSVGSQLLDFFVRWRPGSAEQPVGPTATPEMDTPTMAQSLCALLFATVSGFLGYKGARPNTSTWERLAKFNDGFWRTLSGATRFLGMIIDLVSRMFYWCVKRIPGVKNYFSLESNKTFVKKFVEDAQFCLNEVNINQQLESPEFRFRFWMTTIAAYQLQSQLILSPEPNSAPLSRLINKFITKANELAINLTSTPVRYEPYVLKISGGTKIGKSYMISQKVPEILSEAFGVTDTNPVFVRTPGVEYWNGYRNQKAIIYDDFLAVRDPSIGVTQVVELYNLKSTAIMNMNMANINEKEIKGNPLLVTLIQNNGFNVLNGTSEPKAFLRRADSHWHAALDPKYKSIDDVPADVKKAFGHLIFYEYTDVAERNSKSLNYLRFPAWLQKVKDSANAYHLKELDNVKARTKALFQHLPRDIQQYSIEMDPYSIFYSITNQNAERTKIVQTGYTPEEMTKMMMDQTAKCSDMLKKTRNAWLKLHAQRVMSTQTEPQNSTTESQTQSQPSTSQQSQPSTSTATTESQTQSPPEGETPVITPEISQQIQEIISQIPEVSGVTTQTEGRPEEQLAQTTPIGQAELFGLPGWERMREILHHALFMDEEERIMHEHNRVGPRLGYDTCAICFNDNREIGSMCENGHKVCIECYIGLFVYNPNPSRLPRCPTCRSENMVLGRHEKRSFLNSFRFMVMCRDIYDRNFRGYAESVGRTVRDMYQSMVNFITYRPAGRLLMKLGLTIISYSLSAYVGAYFKERSYAKISDAAMKMGLAHEKTMAKRIWGIPMPWLEKKICIVGKNERESDKFALELPYKQGLAVIGRYDLPNLVGLPTGRLHPEVEDFAGLQPDQNPNWEGSWNLDVEFKPNPNDPSQTAMNCKEFPIRMYNAFFKVTDEVGERSYFKPGQPSWDVLGTPELEMDDVRYYQKDRNSVATRPVLDAACPHKKLGLLHLHRKLDEVLYDRNPLSQDEVGWTIERLNGDEEFIPDAPCQHDDCYWKRQDLVETFIKDWVSAQKSYVFQKMSVWQPGQEWLLPMECKPDSVVAAETQQTQQLQQRYLACFNTPWYEKVGGVFKSLWKWLKIGAALVAGIFAITKGIDFVKWLCKREGTVEPEIISSGSIVTTKLAKATRTPARPTANPQLNESQLNAALKGIERNTFFLEVRYGEDNIKVMRGLGLFGRTGLIPAHYAKFIESQKKKENLTIHFYQFLNKQNLIPIPLTQNLFAFTDSEHCYMSLPVQCQQFKDITHLIPTSQEHGSVLSEYWHIEPSSINNTLLKVQSQIKGLIPSLTMAETAYAPSYTIFDVYKGGYRGNGSCGSAYICDSVKPIFAMHVAGSSDAFGDTGFGIPLIREDIEAFKTGEAVLSYFTPHLDQGEPELSGHVDNIGKVERKLVNHLPMKTKIIPSLLEPLISKDVGEPITQPAILHPRDARWAWDKTPLYWGCTKHTDPPTPFNGKILDATYEELSAELLTVMKPVRPISKITVEEAVSGIKHLEYFDALDMSTSSGWPWNTGAKKTKDQWISFDRDTSGFMTNIELHKDLTYTLDLKESLRQQRIKPFTVFLDWLKDERRKMSKIRTPYGTRIFSLSPLDFTIQLRQNSLDFSASMMKHRLAIPSLVGIQPDGPQWSQLANNLLINSPHIITFDYSDFGPRLPADVGKKAVDLIKDWYYMNCQDASLRDEILTNLDVMYEELFHAYHLMGDFVYQARCGSPSGAATTVIVNSLCNILMIKYIWKYIIKKNNLDTKYLSKFSDYVVLYVYGDDGIMSVKQEVLDWFNLKTIILAFDEHDIVITDADKVCGRLKGQAIPNLDRVKLYSTLQDSTVLKRGFMRHPSRKFHWLAPLSKVSVEETPRWCWKSPDHKEASRLNAEQSVLLAYSHGKSYFDERKTYINEKLMALNLPLITVNWHDLDYNFFGPDELTGNLVVRPCSNEATGLKAVRDVVVPTVVSQEPLCSRQMVPGGLKSRVVEVVDRRDVEEVRKRGGTSATALSRGQEETARSDFAPAAVVWESSIDSQQGDQFSKIEKKSVDQGVGTLFGRERQKPSN